MADEMVFTLIEPTDRNPSRSLNYIFGGLQVLTALAFLMAAVPKLAGVEMQIEMFEKIGMGQWLRYVTGAVEVIGAVLMVIPRSTFIGASLLALTMVGAIATHLLLVGGSAVPAIVLFIITAAIAIYRRPF